MSRSTCPRCPTELEAFSRPVEGGRYADVSMCIDCGGLWVPSESVSIAFPELIPSLEAVTRDGIVGSRACPGCGVELRVFVAGELELDGCAQCGGLWVDGDEILPLEGARAAIDAIGERVYGGSYRTRARAGFDQTAGACSGCGRALRQGEGAASEDGLLCRVCADAIANPIEPPVGLAWRFRRALRRLFSSRPSNPTTAQT